MCVGGIFYTLARDLIESATERGRSRGVDTCVVDLSMYLTGSGLSGSDASLRGGIGK
jgi:hypothetical protein